MKHGGQDCEEKLHILWILLVPRMMNRLRTGHGRIMNAFLTSREPTKLLNLRLKRRLFIEPARANNHYHLE